ncbi:MAG: DUF1003 domain-containing protein [Rudaea sp.]
MNSIPLLRSVALFDGLSDEDLKALADELEMKTFAAGEKIFSQGDTGNAMYIVHDGSINIYLGEDASSRVSLQHLGAGDFFGELSLFGKKPRSASARAVTDTVVLQLQHTTLEGFLNRRPRAAMAILDTISERLRETNSLLSARAARNVYAEIEQNLSWSDHLADQVAELNGSWKFILLLLAITAVWCLINSPSWMASPADPYPYQFYNLALGILVGLQGPLIVMSQNRQGRKDRANAESDFRVNLKNEVNIETLLSELRALRKEMKGARDSRA